MKKGIVFIVLIILISFAVGCSSTKVLKTTGTQVPQTLTKEYTNVITTNYLLYVPKDYNNDKKWPLVLFLHGAGERGNDVNLVAKHGPPKQASEGKDFPFILVSPQCPEGLWWPLDNQITVLDNLLKDIQETYSVDENRIYITGLSMGGYGSWKMLEVFPNRFAAALPICGGGDSTKACAYKDVPIWVFHGAKDMVVPVAQSKGMVNSLKTCGGDPKFTIYPEAGHDSWTETYNNAEVYDWMLKQVKK